jgi:hypothetical protein
MAGGATSMYCGCAAVPPAWLKHDYRIDLEPYVAAAMAELSLAPLPRELRCATSTRLAEAGQTLGFDWQPLLQCMRPGRAGPFE